MTEHDRQNRLFLFIYVAMVMLVAGIFCIAHAEDDPLHTGHTHEGDVGQFYQTWRAPPSRDLSCCNKTDCRPVLEARRIGNGQTEVTTLDAPNFWYRVPEKIWEDAQADPRESPDGRMHVCIMNGRVICAVRASEF